ncbi:MAG: hypothetical protein ACK5O7_06370 [Holosporales bacterium]
MNGNSFFAMDAGDKDMTSSHHQVAIFYTGQLSDWPRYVNDNGPQGGFEWKRYLPWAVVAAVSAAAWWFLF